MTDATRQILLSIGTVVSLLTCGCSEAPAFDIMGSMFPAWLVCIALGVLLSAVTHWLLVRYRISLLIPMVVYPCLAAVFTFAIWLIFF